MSIADKLQTILENEQKVFDAGKKAEYDRFWDTYQQNGNRAYYVYAFGGEGWNDDTYKPKYPINAPFANTLNYTYIYSAITNTVVPISIGGLVTRLSHTFGYCTNLKTIPEITITENTAFGDCFTECKNLENITFKGTIGQNGLNLQWSTKLTRNSIVNIISVLSSSTSGLTITLSKPAVNKAFETATGANNGSTSSQWATLIATKSNWTISLV